MGMGMNGSDLRDGTRPNGAALLTSLGLRDWMQIVTLLVAVTWSWSSLSARLDVVDVRLSQQTAEIGRMLTRLESHIDSPGHPKIDGRVSALEMMLDRSEDRRFPRRRGDE